MKNNVHIFRKKKGGCLVRIRLEAAPCATPKTSSTKHRATNHRLDDCGRSAVDLSFWAGAKRMTTRVFGTTGAIRVGARRVNHFPANFLVKRLLGVFVDFNHDRICPAKVTFIPKKAVGDTAAHFGQRDHLLLIASAANGQLYGRYLSTAS